MANQRRVQALQSCFPEDITYAETRNWKFGLLTLNDQKSSQIAVNKIY